MATHTGENNGSGHAEWRFARAAKGRALAGAVDKMSIRAARFKTSASVYARDPRPVLPLAYVDPSVFPAFRTTAEAEDAVAAALRTGKFNCYPAGVGLLDARRVLTTIDTVMGSSKCIGRAREAAPTGHNHVIPTFARAGDCSLPPRKCDWFLNMGSTVINTDGSCVISASVMCMEAQYRRFNMKYDGSYSWFFKVPTEAVQSLKYMCYTKKAWQPYVGAPTVQGVLEVIHSLKKGILTVYDDISLRLKSYVSFEAGDLSPLEVTSMIQKKGPVIGVLYAGGEAYFRSTVYRGDRAFRANHAVVCTGYRYVDGELCIIIMDNVARAGPFRFVLCEAFEEFHVLTVDTS